MKDLQICTRCVLDEEIPNIHFDEKGVCNYCFIHDRLVSDYPRGEKGKEDFSKLCQKMKEEGRHKNYDCIVGLSGGTDSTYLIYLIQKMGLRPLAVNVDNGWHSETAVYNIQRALSKLGLDLRTYVIEWEEVKAVHRAFLKASLPWVDGSTDVAIDAALYRIASEEGISYILVGHDFRTEGKQPRPWTYTDGRMVRHITKQFSKKKLSSFPTLNLLELLNYAFVKKIRYIRPFWFLDYNKTQAKIFLEKNLGWKDYGGHHHESVFTRFSIAYWLPKKFGIDKRKVTYSALVRSGELTKQEALIKLKSPPCDPTVLEEELQYVIRKLDLSAREFQKIMESENRLFEHYPSYFPLYKRTKKLAQFILSRAFGFKPMLAYES